ncbi:hypothetical protein Moror_14339 [Moniliophthora roreri MCA 2997]|uniref:Glycosyltransferase family 1 protein n=1 Tax=Moniliophthora roreri (strain MCA 2997) TaxID=1381753 RepID=V2XQ32_MONRO|nr:hypothetical protein Moror_14339 [Moniliophthora roreri MCA 2997]
MSSDLKHILAWTISGGWGHARPMLAFLTHLVKTQPVQVTFAVSKVIFGRSKDELPRHFTQDQAETMKLIKLVEVSSSSPMQLEEMKANYEAVLDSILADPSQRDPDVFLTDVIAFCTIDVAQSKSRKPYKIVGWCSVAPMLLYSHLRELSESFSGLAGALDEIVNEIEEKAKSDGLTFRQAAVEVNASHITGKIIQVPGLPPVADHEMYPQEPPYFLPFDIHFNSLRSLALMDGLVSPTAYCLEPNAYEALSLWFEGRPIFLTGPLYPSGEDAHGAAAKAGELAQAQAAGGIEQFLDRVLEERGRKSLLYISFGSTFSTVVGIDGQKLWAWIDVVLDMDIPVVLAYPPQNAPFPEALQAKIDASKVTFICQYAPQQYVLSHPATGWFLTHNGLSGTVETLQAGIPMISWPICADQPVYAMLNALALKSGYELHEVRRGHGLKYRPSYEIQPIGTLEAVRQEAKEVLAKAFLNEEEKKKMQSSAAVAQAKLAEAWVKDKGSAREAMDRFVRMFL